MARLRLLTVPRDLVDRPRDEVVTDVVVGTILHGQVLRALRRLAHEEVSARRWRD